MAPRLPPAQQKLADNFFAPQTMAATAGKRQKANMARIMRGAINGSFRSTALDVKSVLPDNRVALRRVGIEPVKN